MNAKYTLFRTAGLLAGVALLLPAVRAAEADAFPVRENNYIRIGAAGASISGSDAAFQARTQNYKTGSAGIQELSIGRDLSKDTALQIDGRALPGNEDYLAQFKVTKNEVGSFEAGYKRSRTFYDGAGGFFPGNNAWLPIFQRELYVDRGNFFLQGTLELPKAPVLTLRYSNQTRNGRKDSTIWGESDLTGIPSNATPARKILPAYMLLGERQENLELTAKQTVGNTTGILSVIATRINNLDTRYSTRYEGELKPYPAISGIVPNAIANSPTRGFDQQGFEESALTFMGRVETVLSEKATVFLGASYRHSNEDITSLRIMTATVNTGGGVVNAIGGFSAPGGRPPYSYSGSGGLKMNVLTGSVGVELKPSKDLHATLALRGENMETTGQSVVSYTSSLVTLSTGAISVQTVNPAPNTLKITEKPWTPEVSVRYTGIAKLALYGSADYRNTSQDEQTGYGSLSVNTTAGVTSAGFAAAADSIKERHLNAKVGANWTPSTLLNVRTELFTKDHENRFDGYGASAGSFYYLDYDIYGARVTATVRPLPVVAFTTRYIVQRGKTAVSETGYAMNTAGDSRRYQLGETIDWNPSKLVFVQASANVVFDSLNTSYQHVTGTANDVVRNADNNYWNASLLTSFVVDKDTDAQIQATYYKADNFDAALLTTQPYGAGGRDYSVTVGVKHRFSDRLTGLAKVGFLDSRNDTTGGNTNFRGPLALLSVEYGL